jgi:hypothetical protein
MTATDPTASKWTCDRCGVSVSRMNGERVTLPDSWASGSDGRFCLTCRRERAAEAALDAAPEDCSSDARAKLRRSGLLEFEVRRAPDRADNAIAKACHTSASAVAAARREVQPQAKAPARR